MLNFPFRSNHSNLPSCLKNAGLVIVDLDTLLLRDGLDERRVGEELTEYFRWKHNAELVFDPLYPGVREIHDMMGKRAFREAQRIVGYWEVRAVPWTTPNDQMISLVRLLSLRNTLVAVTSERSQHATTSLLRRFGLEEHVVMAVGGDDVNWPRPDPEMLQTVLAATGFAPDEAVYLGSRRSDYELGRRAGVPTYFYKYALGPGSPLPSHSALVESRRRLTALAG